MLNLLFTQAEIGRVRMLSQRELATERARVSEDARMFRLLSTPTDSAGNDERLTQSSVEEVHQALFFNLDLLKRTLGLHSCVLLMRDESGPELRIVELVTDSDDIAEGPFAVGAGRRRRGVSARPDDEPRAPQAGLRGHLLLPRRRRRCGRSWRCRCARAGQVRGVLCADRLEDRPFTRRAKRRCSRRAITHLLRALENERVFVQLERSKREQAVLHRASQALGAALTEQAVLEAALSAAAADRAVRLRGRHALRRRDARALACARDRRRRRGHRQPELPRQHVAHRDGGARTATTCRTAASSMPGSQVGVHAQGQPRAACSRC